MRSQPLPKDKIAYGYCLVLGRHVDGGGSESYVKALESGSPISEVLSGLAGSEEFTKKLAAWNSQITPSLSNYFTRYFLIARRNKPR